jgi:hypothetical protein
MGCGERRLEKLVRKNSPLYGFGGEGKRVVSRFNKIDAIRKRVLSLSSFLIAIWRQARGVL